MVAVPDQAVGGDHVTIPYWGATLEWLLLPIDFRFAITPMKDAIRLAGIYEFGGEGQPFRQDLISNMLAHIGKVLPGIPHGRHHRLARVPLLPARWPADHQRLADHAGPALSVRVLFVRHDQRPDRRPVDGRAGVRLHA